MHFTVNFENFRVQLQTCLHFKNYSYSSFFCGTTSCFFGFLASKLVSSIFGHAAERQLILL